MTRKAYAKVNIFLKIVGKRGNYHEILSRFVLVKDLFDTLTFVPKKTQFEFELYGEFGCALEQNSIYKAYLMLCEFGYEREMRALFAQKALHVDKKIPSFAGLGGGSSDAASFLHMANESAHLHLRDEELARIGLQVGADVPFFVSRCHSANVSGIGEVVECFREEPLRFEIVTPELECSTAAIYSSFREHYREDAAKAEEMETMRSIELLECYDAVMLNDLFTEALRVEPGLSEYYKDGWFFSGSGSSFFRVVKNG